MNLLRRSVLSLSLLGLSLAISSPAFALALRTFVGSTGNDANVGVGCPRATPCRNLQAGIDAVASGGEVVVLDSAGYGGGGVSITKGVTINAPPGVYAGISVSSGTGITVAAGASDIVTLINLQLNGSGGGAIGLQFTSGQALYLKGCSFSEFSSAGVKVVTASVRALIENAVLNGNGIGLHVTAGRVSVSQTTISNNADGIHAVGDGGASLNPPSGTTMVRVSGGNVTDNTTAFHQTDAGIRPMGSCNGQNIYIRSSSGGGEVPNAIGNGTYVIADGASDLNLGCAGPPPQFNIGSYFPGTQGTP